MRKLGLQVTGLSRPRLLKNKNAGASVAVFFPVGATEQAEIDSATIL